MNEEASADQIEWLEFCRAMRSQITKTAMLAPAMNPEEIKTLVAVAENLPTLEHQVHCHDKNIELRLAVVPAPFESN